MQAVWRKFGDEWLLHAPDGQPGQQVTVIRRGHDPQPVTLGERVARDRFRIAKRPPRSPYGGSPIELRPDRVYLTGKGEQVRIRQSRTTGKLYGQVLTGDEWRFRSGVLAEIVSEVSV